MNSAMAKRSEMVFIPGPAGELEGIFSYVSRRVTHLAVLCHPHPLYGGTMHNKVIYSVAMALSQIGFATIRFNFRGVGRSAGSFNHGIGEQRDVEAVIDHFHGQYPDALMVVGGFSFGAKFGMLAGSRDERVSALIGVGVTVDVADYSFLFEYDKPKLILQGSHDQYGSLHSVQEWFDSLQAPKKLVVIDGAVHLFDGKLSELKSGLISEFPPLLETAGVLAKD